MKKIVFLAVTAFLCTAGASAQEQIQNQNQTPLELTLEQCLNYAMGENYTRQSVQLNEPYSEEALLQARRASLPSVSASLSETVSNTNEGGTSWNGNYGISANMPLYQGGQINASIQQNELLHEQTLLQTRQFDNELAIRVLQAFLTALGNEELLKNQEAIVEASREQMIQGKARFEAGEILESDYLLLEAQYATDQNNIVSTRISRDNGLNALKNLMAMELSRPIELVYPDDSAVEQMLILPSQYEVVSRGMETMPEVRISEYDVEIAELGVKITRSYLAPSVSLSAGVGTGHSPDFDRYGTQLSDRFGPQAGITVSIPIFNTGRSGSDVRQSRIALRQAELDKQQSLLDIEQTLINEYGNLVASGSLYKASEIRQNAYNSSFQAYREMFRVGAITAVELLQQQNNYITALSEYIQNKYTFMLQRKVLDVYMGVPIEL